MADAIETAEGRRRARLPARLEGIASWLKKEFGILLPVASNGELLWEALRILARDLEAGRATIEERHAIAERLRRVATFVEWLIPRYRDRGDRAVAAENALARHMRPRELAALLDQYEPNVRSRLARRWRDLAAELLGERT